MAKSTSSKGGCGSPHLPSQVVQNVVPSKPLGPESMHTAKSGKGK